MINTSFQLSDFQDILNDFKAYDLRFGFSITLMWFPQADMTISLKYFKKICKNLPPEELNKINKDF